MDAHRPNLANSAPIGIKLFNILPIRPIRPELRSSGYKYYTLGLTFFIYCSYHASRKPISVAKDALHPSCNTTTTHIISNCSKGWPPFDGANGEVLLGDLDLAFLFAYAVGMFLTGHIAERMNLRHFLCFGMLASCAFTVLFGLGRYWRIHELWYYICIQILAGLFQSTGWPPVVNIVANWFGKGRRGLVMGLWNSHTSLGNIIGSLIAAAFVEYNWGLSFIVPGVMIGCMGVITFLFLTPYPKDVGCESAERIIERRALQRSVSGLLSDESSASDAEPLVNETNSTNIERQPEAISFIRALKIPGVVEFAICLFFSKLVSYTFLFWLPKYISSTTSYGAGFSAILSTVFDIGGIVGGVIAGVVSDKTGGGALICVIMLALAAPVLLVYNFFGNTSLAVSCILLFVCGSLVNGPYALITTAVSADLGSHHTLHGNSKALSTVSSIIDGTGSLGAALGPLLTGILSSSGDWTNVFIMLIASDVIALLVSAYTYFKYDRHKAIKVADSGVTSNSCRMNLERSLHKPTCLRPRILLGPLICIFIGIIIFLVAFKPSVSRTIVM